MIYSRLLKRFNMLLFSANLRLLEFQVRSVSWVSQDLILGPKVFLIHICDLPNVICNIAVWSGISFVAKFLSPEVALYVYISTIQLFMECCCYFLSAAPSCYLKLTETTKRIYRTVGPSLTASFEPITHCWNVGITLVGVHCNWLN